MLACLSLMDFKLRNNLLDMTAVYRSQNAFESFPGNLIALREIQKDLADELSVEVGTFELAVLSSHIYERDFDSVQSILRDVMGALPER